MDLNSKSQKHFHCYATANDSRFYSEDLRNLQRIRNIDSGVDSIFLYISISQVKKSNLIDRIFIRAVRRMFKEHRSINLMEIICKSNIGRDFSSYQTMLEKVKAISTDDDYILFQNRSGYGPFRENWYRKFVEQFEKFDSVALCGSTINFKDHPSRSSRNNLPHVQTYSFLSNMFFMNMLGESFPGANETDRNDIITKGEIGLSQFFLEKNYKITCIEWPNEVITNQSPAVNKADVKKAVTCKHCFYHRRYFRGFGALPRLLYVSIAKKLHSRTA